MVVSMTLSQYLGRGVVSRGRMTITGNLDTAVSEHPYLHNAGDKEAVILGLKSVIKSLSVIKDLKWILPPANTTVEDFVNGVSFFLSLALRWWVGGVANSRVDDRVALQPSFQPLDGYCQAWT